ncbi:MAG TPA: NlpC/P60 family protein [Solirubrobacter sp.]
MIGHGWLLRACALTAFTTLLVLPDARAAARPALTVEETAAQGAATLLSADPHGAKRCSLVTVGPSGRARSYKVKGGQAYGLLITLRRNAPLGVWDLSLRCGRRSSATASLSVTGTARGSGGLVGLKAVRPYSAAAPAGYGGEHPDQDAAGAPALDFDPSTLDGLGGSEGDRGRGAIEWALGKLGNTNYHYWCLRFVANAYGADRAGYASAQVAANALHPRDAAKGVGAAPAGALVFFRWETDGHVGISLGDGRMVHAVATVRAEAPDAYWRSRYLGWAFPPSSWPGRPATPAPANDPVPTTTPTTPTPSTPAPSNPTPSTPAPAPRKVITVDNRVTNGAGMREDSTPARLNTKPWIRCSSRGCAIGGTERSSGGAYDAAVCQTSGERTTNGNDSSSADDANPERFESTRYYGVRLADGTFGYVSEVWIRAADRGGLGLPSC